jgi:hypothetical protein
LPAAFCKYKPIQTFPKGRLKKALKFEVVLYYLSVAIVLNRELMKIWKRYFLLLVCGAALSPSGKEKEIGAGG